MFRYRGYRPYRFRRRPSLLGPIVFLGLAIVLVQALIVLVGMLLVLGVVLAVAFAILPAFRGAVDRITRAKMPAMRALAARAADRARGIVSRP